VPADRVHVVEVNVPVLLVVNVTMPVGVTAPAPEESATEAVQLVGWLIALRLGGEHDTVVVVDLIVEATVKVPLLPLCTLSPPYVPVMSA
jgi:hypothetical protein